MVELIRPSIEHESQAKELYANWIVFEDERSFENDVYRRYWFKLM